MGSLLKQREERKALVLSARMLAGDGWGDVTIRNVSSRGMMLSCMNPPVRNTFVEIRLQRARIVGRVVWSNGAVCGINSQDAIVLSELMSQPSALPHKANLERRLQPRNVAQTSAQMRVLPTDVASRIFATIFDWSAVALAVAIGAIVLTDLTGDTLRQPFETTRTALARSE